MPIVSHLDNPLFLILSDIFLVNLRFGEKKGQ